MTTATKRRIRGGLIGAAILIGSAMLISGLASCSPPETAFRGELVSEEQLAARVQAESDRIAREAADREADFKIAVAKLDGQRAIDIAELTARYEADTRMLTDSLAALQRDDSAGRADIAEQWASREGWATGLTQGLQTAGTLFPAAAPFVGIGAGLIGLLGWRRGVNKADAATEAVRAVAGGIASLPKDIRDKAKAAIGLQADRSDKTIIAKVVADDELLKVETAVDSSAT